MIHFLLFNIPVYIRPSFWLVLALFGGILEISDASQLVNVAIFIIAGLIAILGHELGHALVGRNMGATHQTIILEMCGGVTLSQGKERTKAGRVLTLIAGPLVTFILGLISLAIAWYLAEDAILERGFTFWDLVLFPPLACLESENLIFFSYMIMIGEWWTILNILPIYPLDGGQIIEQFIKSPRLVFLIGMITAIIAGTLGFLFLHSYFIPCFMGFFAYSNYQNMRNAPF